MDMAPRWQDGFGVQARVVSKVRSAWGLTEGLQHHRLSTLWLEGVYTFRREVRVTLKLPIHLEERTVSSQGSWRRESAQGLGNIVLGVPLKYYNNHPGSTWSLGITPSIRFPTSIHSGDFFVEENVWDWGISAGFSQESVLIYQYYDVSYWHRSDSDGQINGDTISADVNIGAHPIQDDATNTGLFVMADLALEHRFGGQNAFGRTGGTTLHLGPTAALHHGNVMWRTTMAWPVFADMAGQQPVSDYIFELGVGAAF